MASLFLGGFSYVCHVHTLFEQDANLVRLDGRRSKVTVTVSSSPTFPTQFLVSTPEFIPFSYYFSRMKITFSKRSKVIFSVTSQARNRNIQPHLSCHSNVGRPTWSNLKLSYHLRIFRSFAATFLLSLPIQRILKKGLLIPVKTHSEDHHHPSSGGENVKGAVHRRRPQNLKDLKCFCKEGWAEIAKMCPADDGPLPP